MRAFLLLVSFVLVAPFALADQAPTLRSCSEAHCVVVVDRDGDGAYDWANVAAVAASLASAGANADGALLGAQAEATSEEAGLEGDHPSVAAWSGADLTPRGATPDLRGAHAGAFLGVADHETGEQETLVEREARVADDKGDGVPAVLLC